MNDLNKNRYDKSKYEVKSTYSNLNLKLILAIVIPLFIVAIVLTFALINYRGMSYEGYIRLVGSIVIGFVTLLFFIILGLFHKGKRYGKKLKLVQPVTRKYAVVKALPNEVSADIKTNNEKDVTTASGETTTVTPSSNDSPNAGSDIKYQETTIMMQDEHNIESVTTYNEFAFFINDYFLQKGIKTNVGFELAASIATNRLIILNHNEQKNLLIDNINACFNSPKLVVDATEKEFISEEMALFDAINTSKSFRNAPVILIVNNLNKEKAGTYLEPIKDLIINQNKINVLNISNNSIQVPTNLYILVVLDDSATINDVPSDMVKYSTCLHFEATLAEAHEELAKSLVFDKFNIVNALNRLKNSEFLDEEYWKKVDSIEDLFISASNFGFDNKLLIALEGYVACMLNNLKDPELALDEAIANLILPISLRMSDPLKLKGENDITMLFNSLFSEDSMQLSRKVIKSYFDAMSKDEQ